MPIQSSREMFKVPEKYRIKYHKNPLLNTTEQNGNNGCFEIPLSYSVTAFIIASDGAGWEHISVHLNDTKLAKNKNRTPTWAEMSKIKAMFWDDEDCVVQYHPPKSEYVSNHDFTLHLWRQIGKDFPRPPHQLVGIKF